MIKGVMRMAGISKTVVSLQPEKMEEVTKFIDTKGGVHGLDGTPLRKNYAGIGYKYDEDRDAFIPQKPYNSWTLNETTCLWEAPSAYPDDGKDYKWNEETTSWDEIT